MLCASILLECFTSYLTITILPNFKRKRNIKFRLTTFFYSFKVVVVVVVVAVAVVVVVVVVVFSSSFRKKCRLTSESFSVRRHLYDFAIVIPL